MAYQLTDEDRKMAQEIGMRQFQESQPAQTTKKPSGGLGSFLLGLLPGGSLLDKGLRGEEISGGDVATEVGLSLVPFGLGKVARGAGALLKGGKAATGGGLKGKIGKSLETRGQELLGTQANLTRAEGRDLLPRGVVPEDVLGSINRRTGLTKIEDMRDVADNLTGAGDKSLLDTITRSAVAEGQGVKLSDLRRSGEEILGSGGSIIGRGKSREFLDNMTKAGVTVRGGADGSLNPLADGNKVLDQANIFRDSARTLRKGPNVTPADKQLSQAYDDMARRMEKELYATPGVNESLPLLIKSGRDDLANKAAEALAAGNKAQSKAYIKLAEGLGDVKDIKDLRTFKKEFAQLEKIDEATANARGGAAAQLGDQMQGLGKIVQRPTNIVAMPLNAATPAVGGLMTRAGRALQGTGGNSPGMMSSPLAQFLLPQAGVRMGADALGLRGSQEAAAMPSEADGVAAGLPNQAANMLGSSGDGQGEGTMYTREAAAQDIQNDLQATGGANMEKYLKLYEFLNPADKKKEKQASVKEFSQARSGLGGVEQIEQMLQQNPELLAKSTIPGQNLPLVGGLVSNMAGTGEYNALTNNVLNSLARLNTGANMPASEEAFYRRLLPAAGDSQETVQQKLAQLQQAFEPFTSGY